MVDAFAQRYAEALRAIRLFHRGQRRVGGRTPTWRHAARVSRILEVVLNETEEGNKADREDIIIAALGHDLLEDTDASEETVKKVFGERGFVLIEGMTNRFGDDKPEPYATQVSEGEEGVRLIKLSDIIDNCLHATYYLRGLDLRWATDHYLPIVRPMIAALLPTTFTIYPKTAELLKIMASAAYTLFLDEVEVEKKRREESPA